MKPPVTICHDMTFNKPGRTFPSLSFAVCQKERKFKKMYWSIICDISINLLHYVDVSFLLLLFENDDNIEVTFFHYFLIIDKRGRNTCVSITSSQSISNTNIVTSTPNFTRHILLPFSN